MWIRREAVPLKPELICSSGGRLRGSEIGRGLLAATPVSLNVIGDLLTLREAAHARTLDGADVHEHIPAALVGLNEAIPLLFVEPLYSTGRHCVSFHGRVHESRTRTAGAGSICRSSGGVV